MNSVSGFGAALVLALGLAGCSGGSSSGSAAQPSVTASPQVTAPEPPVLPSIAGDPTEAGAIAFYEYWWGVYAYAFEVQDESLLRSISDLETCKFCAESMDRIQGSIAEGSRQTGGEVDVLNPTIVDVKNDGMNILIESDLQQAEVKIYEGGSAEPSKSKKSQDAESIKAALEFRETTWVLLAVDLKGSE